MSVVLDHLTAFLVGSVLLVALVALQQRGQQGAVEATLRYRNHTAAAGFLDAVERDVENIRTMSQMGAAFGGDGVTDSLAFSVQQGLGTDGRLYTSQFAFPTLAAPPEDRGAPTDPRGEVAIVVYHVTPTGHSIDVDGTDRPTYRARRYVYRRGDAAPAESGGSADLVDFDVTLFRAGVPDTVNTDVAEIPSRVHVAVVAATALPARRAGDQAATTTAAVTRHARTVYVANAAAGGSAQDPDVDDSLPGGIPALPGD